MESFNSNYCRLCAESKPTSKLLDLQDDDGKRDELTAKLNRVNATIDFTQETLPKTVCLVCVDKLDRALEFVESIQQAQGVLNDLFLVQQIKEEVHTAIFSDDDNFSYEPLELDTVCSLKNENLIIKEETDELPKNSQKVRVKNKAKSHKNKLKDSTSCELDALPLSQLKLSWKDYNWTCNYCETQFPTVDELTNHSMQYHNTCNAYRCTDCNIRKLRLDSFLIHVKRHKKHLKLSCYKCHKRFSTPYKANDHAKGHKDTNFICWGCNTTFSTSDELNNHTKMYYHTKKGRPLLIGPEIAKLTDNLTCLTCKKTFRHKGSLHSHLLIHTERKRDHTCDKCGKCFLHKQNLEGHMLLHENKRPHQCKICKAAFKTHGQLRNHVGVHDNKKPFACDQCGRCFRLQKQLTSHSIIHTDELPHVCSYCNKAFRFKTILNQHIRQHTGVKPYSCSLCLRDFTNWPNYNKHMKRRHGMDMAKKKHTPEGVYPIDPNTGEIIVNEEASNLEEWKNQMMSQRRPGRPKVNPIKTEEHAITNDTNSGMVNLNQNQTE